MARQPGERERLTRWEITMYSKTCGHSYSVCVCVRLNSITDVRSVIA